MRLRPTRLVHPVLTGWRYWGEDGPNGLYVLADRPRVASARGLVHRRQVAAVVEGHQGEPRLAGGVVQRRGGGWRRRPGRSTRRRRRSAGCRATPASAGSSRSPRRWRPGSGRGPATVSAEARSSAHELVGVGARAGSRPAAASRPWRTTWTAHRPSSSRRAATTSGQRVSALSRWVRAAARMNAASRSRWTPASSNRSSSASAAIRTLIASTTSSGRRSRVSRSWRTTAAYVVASTLPSHGERQRPISASTHGDRRQGSRASRSEHWRTGNVSWRAARHFSAVLRRRERAEVVGVVVEHPADQRQPRPRLAGELDEVHLLGEPGAAVVARLVLGDQPQLADLGLERGGALDAGDRLGEPDHLAHPGPGLGRGEVGADPGAQVAGGADVEDPGAVVAEEVDAGRVRQRLGEVALACAGPG